MNKRLRTLLSGLIIAILALVAVPAADAASIRLTSGSEEIIIDDDGAGDLAPGIGVISFFGSVGVFEFTGTLGVTKPLVGSAGSPTMLLILNTTSTDAGDLEVEFGEIGFGPTGLNAFIQAAGTAANTLTYETFQDPANILFGEAVPLTADTALIPGYVFINSGTLATSAGYSLMQQVTISHASAAQTSSFEGVLVVTPLGVPDGGWAISLLGFGLIGVEGLRRRFTRL